ARLSDGPRGGVVAGRQCALEVGPAAAVRAPGALPRYRRQVAGVQVRAMDSREVDGVAPDLPTIVRIGLRSTGDGAACGRWRRTAVVCRAGVSVRPARAPAQYGQSGSGRGGLGQLATARLESPPRAGADSEVGRRFLHRSGGPLRARPARWQ